MLNLRISTEQVLANVRERIKRRNAIEHPRDRYAFVATEYFKKHSVSAEFLSVYIENICGLRVELVSILGEVSSFLELPLEIEKVEEIIDDMLTYKETLEGHLAVLDVTNQCFMVRISKFLSFIANASILY